ncbi:MAG: hypothetical protein ACRDK2_09585 [Solirubrobacteraceae bacterium]
MLATVAVTGGAMVALTAAETRAQSPAGRAQIALEAAESTLRLIKPARNWSHLARVPERERRLIGSSATENDDLSRQERAKLRSRATIWVTEVRPRAILTYVRSQLPRDATAHGESSSGTSYARPGPPGPHTSTEIERNYKPDLWREEFTVPPVNDVLRRQALTVFIAKAAHGRFVIRLEGAAVWEGIRPGYSLLGTGVHVITITNTFPAPRDVGPSPTSVSEPALVEELIALVNAIPIFEDKGAVFSCPSEKPGETSGTFEVTFAEQPGAPALATLEGQPYACGESFLPIISVPGHPPLELSVEPALVTMLNRIAGLHLPKG